MNDDVRRAWRIVLAAGLAILLLVVVAAGWSGGVANARHANGASPASAAASRQP